MHSPAEKIAERPIMDVPERPDASQSLRLLFITRNHLPHVGGAEISTHHLALALVASGHEVRLITQLRQRSAAGVFDRAVSSMTGRSPARVQTTLGYPVTRAIHPLTSLEDACRDLQPDAVMVTGTDPSFAMSVLQRTERTPSVLYIRGAHAVPFVLSGVHYDVVVANSPFIATSVRNLGVDATFLPSVFPRDIYRVSTTRERVLFVNPIPKKGVDIALFLASQRPDIPFVFSLSWRMKRRTLRQLHKMTRQLGNVEVRTATHDPTELFRDARLVLIPTRWPEAWPRVASEAQISGIPVIGSHVGGIAESIGRGGLVVKPPHSRAAWLEALSQAWDDPGCYERLTREALRHSRRPEMTVDGVVRRFEGLVRSAIERHVECP